MTISRELPERLGIIAGNGVYPRLLADGARRAGVTKIVAAAFTDETDPTLEQHVELVEWMRVGQLGRLLSFFAARIFIMRSWRGKLRRKIFSICDPT